MGSFQHLGEVYLQTVLDTYSNYAFGLLHPKDAGDYAVLLLHNEVLPFFKRLELPVRAIHTDSGRDYFGKADHHYRLYLGLNAIEHRRSKSQQLAANTFIRRFNHLLLVEVFKRLDPHGGYPSLKELQLRLEAWLNDYNRQRPADALAQRAHPPAALIAEYIASRA